MCSSRTCTEGTLCAARLPFVLLHPTLMLQPCYRLLEVFSRKRAGTLHLAGRHYRRRPSWCRRRGRRPRPTPGPPARRTQGAHLRLALLGLASLLCLSVCGSIASSALSVLVFKDSRIRGAIQPVVLSDSKAAAPVGTGLTPYGTVASRPPPPPPRQRDSLSAERLRLDSAVATPPPPSDDSLSSSKASNAPPATPVAPSQAGGLLSATHVQAWLALYTFVDSGKCLFVGIWPVCLTSKESRPLSQMVGMKSVIFPRQCL